MNGEELQREALLAIDASWRHVDTDDWDDDELVGYLMEKANVLALLALGASTREAKTNDMLDGFIGR